MGEALVERARERERLLEVARGYVASLARRRPLVAAVVVGSVARGDFNLWSDVDVVVVAEGLPERAPVRGAVLSEGAPGGVHPIGFTPEEFRAALRRGNPLAREAVTAGVVVTGAEFLGECAADAAASEA